MQYRDMSFIYCHAPFTGLPGALVSVLMRAGRKIFEVEEGNAEARLRSAGLLAALSLGSSADISNHFW